MLKLVEADSKYLDEYKEAYELSLKKIKEGKIKEHDLMFMDIDKVDVIQYFRNSKDETKLKPGRVLAYEYFIINDADNFIGVVSIRVSLTDKLLQFGGNIGYGINPKYWRKGYGTECLRLALIKSKELVKEDKVLITCDDDNVGSYKIIEHNGGILENKVINKDDDGTEFLTRRYWINIPKE